MLDQPPATHAARPCDHVQHALGEARLERDLLELERGQRRQLGRLQDDGVAGRQGRRDLPRRDDQREVPGDDQADYPEWLAEGHVDAAGDRDRLSEQPLGRSGVVAEGLDDHGHLAARVRDRLAGVARLQRRELLAPAVERIRQPVQQQRPIAGRDRTPAGERAQRALDRCIRLLRAGFRNFGQDLLGRRLDHGDHQGGSYWWKGLPGGPFCG